MSTDFQQAREALGLRLRGLRTATGLNGKEWAGRLGWQRSKVSRLETGKQTATPVDVTAWAAAAGAPEAADELIRRLDRLETHYRSWRRQLSAGHRAVQERHGVQESQAREMLIFESGIIPGLVQTPEYARGVLTDVSARHGSPADVEEGVTARMRRQEILYRPGRSISMVLWEAALYVVRCEPPAMAAQLDRLCGLVGLDAVTIGIIPLGARTPFSPKHGFWIIDDRVVVADTWSAELSLDSAEDLALYRRLWTLLHGAAVHGHQAHALITRARGRLA
ncbi:helix-turn-helix domain-containing protein [Streptomyces lichenis]|uniref:Helix-turn-helix domain-containing protein n=1 Tax=Streptomyces lichenis TaxID=2306967 RepID=A0ABT0II23_9ACTN|nr:helix-turn-helix transcriptional regulator [Streptomyces lichenis]MCK8680976.1 helix-turn-helix domain-containing protein [Streptomyces lichenis]